MLIYNHTLLQHLIMKIIQDLESILFNSPNSVDAKEVNDAVQSYLSTVQAYAEIDGAIVVLSDLVHLRSYICVGMLGAQFGFAPDVSGFTHINSIWEDDIYSRIHPDDLFQKYILELKYCHFLKNCASEERSRYSTYSRIRMMTTAGDYQYVSHSTVYRYDSSGETLLFGTCLYGVSLSQGEVDGIGGRILDKRTGLAVEYKRYNDCSDMLSSREKEVLSHIKMGHLSKEIADFLGISLNTVNRHRQNILHKIGVNNSFEAIKIAEVMDLI